MPDELSTRVRRAVTVLDAADALERLSVDVVSPEAALSPEVLSAALARLAKTLADVAPRDLMGRA